MKKYLLPNSTPYDQQLLPHLFRNEYTKLTAVLTRLFGLKHIEIAEDIASDTFLAASENWGQKGIPANPTAWLYTVAKNKTLDLLKRDQLFHQQVKKNVAAGSSVVEELNIDFSLGHIQDSVLEMMFAVCNPLIPAESQVSLALQILCGFSVDEIASAFLTNRETIKKRLFRARERLRNNSVDFLKPVDRLVNNRLGNVLTTIYLLFNEGYFSKSADSIIKKDVCSEAIRLAYILTHYEQTNTAAVNALLALMCFQSSRFDARLNEQGEAVLFEEQDRRRWDAELIEKGNRFLFLSAKGDKISRYHYEAAIAYWHTTSEPEATKWNAILQSYNQLLILEYSPIAALNRTYAFFRVYGKRAAIAEAEKLKLNGNHFYHSLLGELYTGIDHEQAITHLQKALSLTTGKKDKQLLQNKINTLSNQQTST